MEKRQSCEHKTISRSILEADVDMKDKSEVKSEVRLKMEVAVKSRVEVAADFAFPAGSPSGLEFLSVSPQKA